MKRKIIIAILVLGSIGAGTGFYLYNKPHKNYSRLKADFEMSAVNLCKEYEDNEDMSNSRYLDKLIQVSGAISGITPLESGGIAISLFDPMFGVTCTIEPQGYMESKKFFDEIKIGDVITMKGRCDGMLTDVRLSKCSVVK